MMFKNIVCLISILPVIYAVRNCKHTGVDIVTDAEYEQYCSELAGAYGVTNNVRYSVDYDSLYQYLYLHTSYATYSVVKDIYAVNVSHNGCVERDGVCHASELCKLVYPFQYVRLENLCILKDAEPTKIPQFMTLKSGCPFDVSVGQKLIVALDYPVSLLHESGREEYWMAGYPDTDTVHVKHQYLIEATPEVLQWTTRMCGYQNPRVPGGGYQDQCPTRPQDPSTCDVAFRSEMTLVSILMTLMIALLLTNLSS